MTRDVAGRAIRLYVNIDHVATIREARKTDEPDPVAAAALCEDAGADGITVHLREDRRHIQDRDVERLAERVRTVLNLELATSDDVLALACRLRPFQATIVPERREEITTEGGLDLRRLQRTGFAAPSTALTAAGCRVSLFIDPDPAADRHRPRPRRTRHRAAHRPLRPRLARLAGPARGARAAPRGTPPPPAWPCTPGTGSPTRT